MSLETYTKKGALPMLEHQDKLNGSATAFIRAFSDLIKDSTSHLATKDDIDTINKNMQAQFAQQEERIDTTNKNMQAQFAQQEKKFAEINRNMQARFTEQDEKFAEINRKLT